MMIIIQSRVARQSRHAGHRRRYLCAAIAAALALPAFQAFAADATPAPDRTTLAYGFDSSLVLGTSLGAGGLERFNRANVVDPGDYQVDISVNGVFRSRKTVEFRAAADGSVFPCLDNAFLIASGVRADSIASTNNADSDSAQQPAPAVAREPVPDCRPLEQRVAGAISTFDFSRLRLDISIPQLLMTQVPRGTVNPGDLDAGATVAFVNYDASYYRYSATGRVNDYSYLGLNSGVNVGMWRLRQQSNYRYTSGTGNGGGHWNAIRTYAQRALPALQSELTAGDTYTSGNLFSSVGFRGVQIGTDERMLPASQSGYAPVVRGVALTNARVVIRQGGNQIYQTTVAPGPFLIGDLYSTSYQGDLEVEVTEADGRIARFTVPFSAVPDSMRPGTSRYGVTLGQVRDLADSRALFTDMTYQRGLTNALTANAGARLARDYQAFLVGAVMGTSVGAFGVNTTYSLAKDVDGKAVKGGRAALTYSHTFLPTSTTFSLAGYRYSTRGYRDLVDALGSRSAHDNGKTWSSSSYQQRNQFTANISQNFDRYGQLSLSASASDYYGATSPDTQLQFNYANTYRSISYNLSFARQRTASLDDRRRNLPGWTPSTIRDGKTTNAVMLSVSMPLGWFGSGSRAASVSGGVTHSAGISSYQASVSGIADEAQTLSYSANVSGATQGASSSASASLQKSLPMATVGGNYSLGQGFWQASANARGAAVAHAGGLTLGPYLGETFGLVEAKGASGAAVRNSQGARIDRFGYALIPSLTAYRYNDIALDSQGIGRNVELDGNQQRVAPYAGAAVKLNFATRTGYALLVKTALADGSPLPLGANVYAGDDGASIGMVGQGGQVYARAAAKQGRLRVKWGEPRADQCEIRYDLGGRELDQALYRLNASCVKGEE